MKESENLTHEYLMKVYAAKSGKNRFELVLHAIRLAENMILSGRDTRIKTTNQNKAVQVVEEIAVGKDSFEDLPKASETKNVEEESRFSTRRLSTAELQAKRESRFKDKDTLKDLV